MLLDLRSLVDTAQPPLISPTLFLLLSPEEFIDAPPTFVPGTECFPTPLFLLLSPEEFIDAAVSAGSVILPYDLPHTPQHQSVMAM